MVVVRREAEREDPPDPEILRCRQVSSHCSPCQVCSKCHAMMLRMLDLIEKE